MRNFWYIAAEMTESKEKEGVFLVKCPCCHAKLWIDSGTETVLDAERGKAKKGSLDDLLVKEKKKKEEVDRKFAATAVLAKERQQKAREKFEKALTEVDQD
jgi:hypothetical protein